MSEGGGGGFDNFKIPGNTESGFDPVADDKKFEIESKEKDKSLIQRLLRKADEDSEKLGFFERHKVKRVEKKAAKAERRAEKRERNALKTYSAATEAGEYLKSADEQTQASEAERITQDASRDPLLTEAAQQVVRESRRIPEEHVVNRFPEAFKLPEQTVGNLANALEEVLNQWGATPDEIRTNIEAAGNPEVFKSIWKLTEAEIQDKGEQDNKLNEMKEAAKLKTENDVAYEAITDPENSALRTDPETGRLMVDVTPDEVDGKPTATAGREPGKLYKTYDTTVIGNVKMYLDVFQNTIRTLVSAGKAAKSQADGNPITLTYTENPEADGAVATLYDYLDGMATTTGDAAKVFKDPKKVDTLLKVATKLTKDQQPGITDKDAEILAKQTIADGPQMLEKMHAFYDAVNKKPLEWGGAPEIPEGVDFSEAQAATA